LLSETIYKYLIIIERERHRARTRKNIVINQVGICHKRHVICFLLHKKQAY